MKKKYFFIIFLLIINLIYIVNINQIPEKIYLIEGEKIQIKKFFGIEISNQTDEKEVWEDKNTKKEKIDISLFGILKVKEVSVTIYPRVKVIPTGNLIGLKLYTNGVLVIGIAEIDNSQKDNKNIELKEGDILIEIDGEKINTTSKLKSVIKNSNGKTLKIKYIRNKKILESEIKPIQTEDGYKIGIWVRDSASGVGTMSFYEKSTGKFAALGHGISDSDTDELLNIEKGEIVNSKIINLSKGQNGVPGEIRGSISNEESLGIIEKNTNVGIFGTITSQINNCIDKYQEGIEIALRAEIKKGEATILACIEENKVEEFKIEILEVYQDNELNNKSIKLKITDERLLNLTGGIICGMSGSPIIQNNKVIGVLTNVLVSDPSTGYGVFADTMIKEMAK